jgi:tetratricopeptide (TPR) repeat protein
MHFWILWRYLLLGIHWQDNIGVVNMNLGDSESALHYHRTALLMREAKLGANHLDVAATKDNLGLVYRQLNRTEIALELHTQALEIRMQVVGPDDMATAASKTAIANVYYQREDFDKALKLYNEVLNTQVCIPAFVGSSRLQSR